MIMEWTLELVPIPVSDVDRSKTFYTENVGLNADLDVTADRDNRVSGVTRVVQLTPPGSACSIAIGTGIVNTPPGSVQGLHLVVQDIQAARCLVIDHELYPAPAVGHPAKQGLGDAERILRPGDGALFCRPAPVGSAA